MERIKGKRWLALLIALLLAFSATPLHAELTRAEEQSAEAAQPAPVQEAPKPEPPKSEPVKAEAPKSEAPKSEAPKTEAPKSEAPKSEAPKSEAPKSEEPKTEAPKTEAPKTETTKAPEATKAPEVTKAPEATKKPEVTPTPSPTPSPSPTPEPEVDATEAPAEPTPTAGPDATPAPEVPAEPTPTPGPDATAAPEVDATPAPDATPDPEATPDPDATPEASPSPSPSPTPEAGFELRKKSKSYANNHLGSIYLPSGGMPIPLIYQFNYGTTVCEVNGDSKSVASSGCGAVCASMVIAYAKQDYDQTPYTLFYWAAANGQYYGDGLGYDSIRSMLSRHGVDSRLEGVSSGNILSALEKGRPVIIKMGPGHFTNDGHYILLRGLTADGKVLVNDPNSAGRSGTAYSASTIAGEAKSSHMIVVYTQPDGASAETSEPEATAAPAETPAPEAVAESEAAEAEINEAGPEAVSTTEDGAFDGDYPAKVIFDRVNLRRAPGTNGEIAACVPAETILCVTGETEKQADGYVWCRVIYQGESLYMRGDMLSADGVTLSPVEMEALYAAPEAPAAESEAPAAEPAAEAETNEAEPEAPSATEDGAFDGDYPAKVIFDRVNLRRAPGTNGEIAACVPAETILCVTGETEKQADGYVWCRVIYQGETLYMRGDMLSADGVALSPAEMEALYAAPEAPAAEPAAEAETDEAAPEAPSATEDGAFEGAYLARVNAGSVNLRRQPGEDGEIVASLPMDSAICVVGEVFCDADGHVWYEVMYRKEKLYMRGDMLTALP